MRLWPVLALSAILTLGAAPAALALSEPEASDEPIHVVADKLEVDNTGGVATFSGNVDATQGDVKITSDRLDVHYVTDEPKGKEKDPAQAAAVPGGGGKVRKVVAVGHVKIRQKNRVAVGRKATYWAGGRKMLLEGQATVWEGKNQVSGEKITVFMDQNRSVVHGKPGKRVSVTIVPKKDNSKKKKK